MSEPTVGTEILHRAATDLRRDPERKHAWELAVADWFDSCVSLARANDPCTAHALRIARAYLGEATG